MKNWIKGAVVLAAMSSAVVAQEPAERVTLWQNIEHGMPMEEVQTLYPSDERGRNVKHGRHRTRLNGVVQIGPFCEPSVYIVHPDRGTVSHVEIDGSSCSGAMNDSVQAMIARYGTPDQQEEVERTVLLTNQRYTEITSRWVRGNLIITLRRDTGGWFGRRGGSWTIRFEPASSLSSGL